MSTMTAAQSDVGPARESEQRPVRAWPVLLLAAPAAVAIWSGWVGLGQLTGFGEVHPLPGLADGWTINTAITLPIGMEAYAAYALRAWLTPGTPVRARQFAKRSAFGALILGALGQIAYHLMVAAGVTAAPWPITTGVACLPVAVLGMGAALAHLLRDPSPQAGSIPARRENRWEPPNVPASRPLAKPDLASAGSPQLPDGTAVRPLPVPDRFGPNLTAPARPGVEAFAGTRVERADRFRSAEDSSSRSNLTAGADGRTGQPRTGRQSQSEFAEQADPAEAVSEIDRSSRPGRPTTGSAERGSGRPDQTEPTDAPKPSATRSDRPERTGPGAGRTGPKVDTGPRARSTTAGHSGGSGQSETASRLSRLPALPDELHLTARDLDLLPHVRELYVAHLTDTGKPLSRNALRRELSIGAKAAGRLLAAVRYLVHQASVDNAA